MVGLKKCNRLVKEMRKKQQMRWKDKKLCCDMLMWRAHPEKKKDFEEGRQEHQDEDSKSKVEFHWENMLEKFDLQNTLISGQTLNMQS